MDVVPMDSRAAKVQLSEEEHHRCGRTWLLHRQRSPNHPEDKVEVESILLHFTFILFQQ